MEENNPISLVHNIFINFFGEENVDLQEPDIIVHFPKVKVTNENDRSVDITHLWVKVTLCPDGTIKGSFKMIRSEFTSTQFDSGYSHSHIHHIDTDSFEHWAIPCLGSGPIRDTISSLSTEFSEDLWNLFCLELSKYVTVESVEGVPYMYLERIGTAGNVNEITFPFNLSIRQEDIRYDQIIEDFIPTILEKRPFRFNFYNGSYGIAMSERDILITLSNLFIEWYNSLPTASKMPKQRLYRDNIIIRSKFIENKIYYYTRNTISTVEYDNIIGRELFRFKGEPVTLNIVNSTTNEVDDPNLSILLSPNIVLYIIDRILRTINNKYGQHSEQETNFSTRETHRYI